MESCIRESGITELGIMETVIMETGITETGITETGIMEIGITETDCFCRSCCSCSPTPERDIKRFGMCERINAYILLQVSKCIRRLVNLSTLEHNHA